MHKTFFKQMEHLRALDTDLILAVENSNEDRYVNIILARKDCLIQIENIIQKELGEMVDYDQGFIDLMQKELRAAQSRNKHLEKIFGQIRDRIKAEQITFRKNRGAPSPYAATTSHRLARI